MLATAQPGGATPSPLDCADAAFRALTTGPQPLALHAASLAALPARLVPLDELRALLRCTRPSGQFGHETQSTPLPANTASRQQDVLW